VLHIRDFFGFFYAACLQFLVAGILLSFIAYAKKSVKPLIAAGLLFIFFSFDSIALHIPFLLSFNHFRWNFEGKFIEVLWPLILVYIFGFLNPKMIGIKWPKHKNDLLLGVELGILIALCNIVISIVWFKDSILPQSAPVETILFQFTMPGLGEEIVFRGFLLALLNQYIGFQRNIFNLYSGWGIIIVSFLFILIHTINYLPTQQAIVWNGDVLTICSLVITSFVLGYLRYKTDSIWPCVLAHNFINGVYFMVVAF